MAPVSLARIPDAPSADPKSQRGESASPAPTRMRTGGSRWPNWSSRGARPYARLDLDQDGKLSFEEWAVKTIDKFNDADADKSRALTPAEYATTAPKRKPKPACACG